MRLEREVERERERERNEKRKIALNEIERLKSREKKKFGPQFRKNFCPMLRNFKSRWRCYLSPIRGHMIRILKFYYK